jgi:Fe2+ transport system protein B
VHSDAETTRTALAAMGTADVVLMVARGTHAVSEVETLLQELDLQKRRTALAITFKDKAPAQIESLAQVYRERLGIPVVVINARTLDAKARQEVLTALSAATEVTSVSEWPPHEIALRASNVEPKTSVLENKAIGPWLALFCLAAMFALPVYAAYAFAAWAQPWLDEGLITPLRAASEAWPELMKVMLTGDYGLITLGWYSFLWAFPVVLLISVSSALTEETGLNDRITAALDPALRQIGMSGRDLIPVLTGFGCNVVALFQTRSCSKCSRGACVSMISFGSACSYQIGASLSIFGAAGQPGLFLPYLGSLFLIGALHTRFWHGKLASAETSPLQERAFFQAPSALAVGWRIKAAVSQFLKQAMPIFLTICVVAALLEHFGVISIITRIVGPALQVFHLPPEVASSVVFSILRKDGLLTLNKGEGALLSSLSHGQVFAVVWLASTLTACLVTLWTVRREMGWRIALKIAGQQAATSLVSTWLISLLA